MYGSYRLAVPDPPPARVRILEDSEPFSFHDTTLVEFIGDNADTLEPEEIGRLLDLEPGDEFEIGGGAFALFRVLRLPETP